MTDARAAPQRRGALPWALVPAAAFAALVAITIIWLRLDQAPLVGDQASHVFSALDFANYPGQELTRNRQLYPPLHEMVLGTTLALDGYRVDTAIAIVNLAFLALLLAATYGIGCELSTPRVGAVAALLVALYPATFTHARAPMLDLPLTAMVSAALYAALRSHNFADLRWSLALGLLFGAGCLTKQTFIFAVAAPLVYTTARMRRERAPLTHLALAATIAAAIALAWYAPRLGWFLGDYRRIQEDVAASRGDPGTLSVFGALYYVVGTWHQTSLVFALLWLATLPLFLPRGQRAFLLTWWLGTVALTSTLAIKDTRFLLPALPAIALMTAAGLCRLPRAWLLVVAVSLFGALQVFAASFGAGWLPKGHVVANRVERDERPSWFSQDYRLTISNTSRLDRSGWGIRGGLDNLRGHIGVVGHPFIYQAVRLPRFVADVRTGKATTVVELLSCADRPRFAQFDLIIVQRGGTGAPSDADYTACTAGMTQLRETGLSMENLLPGARNLVVFRPAKQ